MRPTKKPGVNPCARETRIIINFRHIVKMSLKHKRLKKGKKEMYLLKEK